LVSLHSPRSGALPHRRLAMWRPLVLWKLGGKAAKTAQQSSNNVGISTIQGRRPNQEDRYTVVEQLPGSNSCGFYAVYDGHGGDRAAQFACTAMHERLHKSKAFAGKDLIAALQHAFNEVETEFLNIAGREGLRDGTTAVVALVQEDTLTLAHVGDSRGVLCRGGKAVELTHDHKPELEAEKRRIEALGGFVSYIGCWRAMGILAMSRAIGDLFLKPYVSAEPEVSTLKIEAKDEFIVLASDGVFDVFDNEQVVRIVRSAHTPHEAATLLTNSAFVAGSLDNLTAVVVALRGYQPKKGAAASVAEPYYGLHERWESLAQPRPSLATGWFREGADQALGRRASVWDAPWLDADTPWVCAY